MEKNVLKKLSLKKISNFKNTQFFVYFFCFASHKLNDFCEKKKNDCFYKKKRRTGKFYVFL